MLISAKYALYRTNAYIHIFKTKEIKTITIYTLLPCINLEVGKDWIYIC